jgi:carbonic anhydrase
MKIMDKPDRRTILSMGATMAGIGVVAGLGEEKVSAAMALPNDRSPATILKLMKEGNARFAAGKPLTPRRTPADFTPLAASQKPLAAIVGCSDSRVTPELLFDLGIGELFIIRVAGNLVTGAGPAIMGSLEFAVAELGVRLIMVMGHSGCGAMKAAIAHVDDADPLAGSLGDLVDLVKPAVNSARKQPGDLLDNVIKANVVRGGRRLRTISAFAGQGKDNEVLIVGGIYDLASGKVDFFDV